MLTAAMIFLYLRITSALGWMPLCPVHALTGLSCPGCGSQRALHALLDGEPLKAWGYNYIIPFTLAYVAICGMHWIFPDSTRIERIYRRLTTPMALYALLGAVIAWTVARNLLGI